MPKTLTAADFLSLRMQYRAARAENETGMDKRHFPWYTGT